jgi:hypothetical protein
MRKKTIKVGNMYEFCERYTLLLNAMANLGLTPMEVKALAGLFLIAIENNEVNVLSTRNQQKITQATGIKPSNLRSLILRLKDKNLLQKTARAEGYLPKSIIPKKEEQFEIRLERIS